MKKMDGLRFLKNNFQDDAIDTTFIENDQDLMSFYEEYIGIDCFFRVRACNKRGLEIKLPIARIDSIDKVIEFIHNEKKRNSDLDFVIHTFTRDNIPSYVGSIAVYNSSTKPSITIDIQRVTKELMKSMDKIRPRDWPVSVSLEYDFLSSSPKVSIYENINLEEIKEAIYKLFKIGVRIYNIYEENHQDIDTYTRFDIYPNNTIILDDHRSDDSFVLKRK